MIRLRRLLYIGGAFLLLLIKFTIDVISKNVALEIGGLSLLRDLMVVGAFLLLYLTLSSAIGRRETAPVRRLGILLIVTYAVLIVGIAIGMSSVAGFDHKNFSLLPLDYPTLFVASITSVILGAFAVLAVRLLRDLVLFQRRKGTQRNFLLLAGAMLATAASVLALRPLEDSILTTICFVLAIVFAVANSFRLPWIVYLTKREKIYTLVYSFLLFLAFTGINVMLARDGLTRESLLYYSHPLKQVTVLTAIFGNIYVGMAFVSTLFHLPTAEAFDRKRSEVTSLHNLSRLVTQVFDFKELVDTVTTMTLQVCEAKSCWLELVSEDHSPPGAAGHPARPAVSVVAMKNIDQAEIDQLHHVDGESLRDEVLRRRLPVVIDDLHQERRFLGLGKGKSRIASIVVMPLLSHTGLVGILYATKDTAYGFLKDDVDVISAFADQATVAIENSRLINESLARERLIREMMLAQEMQRRLLPQTVPSYPSLDLAAVSTPAFEVGGDYYDFVTLGQDRLGIVVGDVSGKGVPAAFYMSEVKGIFQSLSRMYPSPRDFLVRANEVLMGTVDRHSFISLLFAVLDVRTGDLTIARAGHCPMLLVSGDRVSYVRPGGMGMGLSGDALFAESLQEQTIRLRPGDVCVFYTDGITEARSGEEEYGYDRLLENTRKASPQNAEGIKETILASVQEFAEGRANDDDITLLVLKWTGRSVQPGIVASSVS
ncbi:MAG TPA: GAF domain-containing SpoIIE family protein phosphatase [Bacteroidota bacterium]